MDSAANANQGLHLNGSAVAFWSGTTPTNRPDGSVALGNNDFDKGRLFRDSGTGAFKVWDGSAFVDAVTKSDTALSIAGGMTASAGFADIAGTSFHFKVIDIGDWNMDSTQAVRVDTGINYTKWRGAIVTIRADSGVTGYVLWPLPYRGGGVGTGLGWDHNTTYSDTEIQLLRPLGDVFDTTDYDATSYNRGWVLLFYEV